ncbi:MAG: SCO family protein [Gemmatimonadota bacterium]|nr:SCO family protein [Gemmatimonadota bacterium]
MRTPARSLSLLALVALGCGAPEGDPLPRLLDSLGGEVFVQPYRLPSVQMADQHGRPFDLRTEARGHITFLYFGYVHCPDICPITMATLARALERLEPAEREQVRTVFVGMDPPRDTPEVLAPWLANLDPSFVGLSPTFEELDAILAQLGFRRPPQEYPEEGPYEVAHPGLLFVFTPDRLGRYGYPPDALDADVIATGVRALLNLEWRSRTGVDVQGAAAADPLGQAQVSVYATLVNGGTVADTLLGLSAPGARAGSLHEMVHEGGVMRMQAVPSLVIPAGGRLTLAPGALHGMLEGVSAPPIAGDTLDVSFRLARAGEVVVRVPVLHPADVARGRSEDGQGPHGGH